MLLLTPWEKNTTGVDTKHTSINKKAKWDSTFTFRYFTNDVFHSYITIQNSVIKTPFN